VVRRLTENSRISGRSVLIVVALLAGGALVTVDAQSGGGVLQARLRQLFPAATSFSPKGGDPPHIKAYNGAPGDDTVIGYAFWTTELMPLERGYSGPIAVLVGMDTKGVLTGIIVSDHREPYGDFSIDRPEFAAQFRGKDVRDSFTLGRDIDAVSRATITMASAVRGVRNSARRIARQFLAPPGSEKP
jgi:NosR/NirI family nitrous oxide reductase transcriptional regulator